LLHAIPQLNLVVWGNGNQSIDVQLPPNGEPILQTLQQHNSLPLNYTVVIPNVQAKLNQEFSVTTNAVQATQTTNPVPAWDSSGWFNDFHSYAESVHYLQSICKATPRLCQFIPSVGKSVEKRDIIALKLGNVTKKSKKIKPQIYLQGTIHAREWASTSTVQYIIYRLLSTAKTDKRVKNILSKVEINVIPVLNPDGYEYSRTTDRLWRKNRSVNAGGTFGTDLNRNWNCQWGTSSSAQPSSENYHGVGPNSEPETQTAVRWIQSLPRLIAALDIHSFGKLIVRSLGPSHTASPHETQHSHISEAMASAIAQVSGEQYRPALGYEIDPASGTASDWFYQYQSKSAQGHPIHPYGLTIELRPTMNRASPDGFLLPKEQILPTGQEIFPAFLLYIENALKYPLYMAPSHH
jgi:hypothetical protein